MSTDSSIYRDRGRGFALGMRRDLMGAGTLEAFMNNKRSSFGHEIIAAGLADIKAQGATEAELVEWQAGLSDVIESGIN
jgi:hypothetical protein